MVRLPQKFIYILAASLSFLFSLGVLFALPYWYSGFKKESPTPLRLDLRGVYSECMKVTSSGSEALFIPTRYSDEWSAFKANTPPSLSLENCINGEYVMGFGRKWKHNESDGEGAHFAASFTTTDSWGNLYVIDTQESASNDTVQRVLKFSSTGQLLLVIGGDGGDNNLSGTSAQLNRPVFINVDTAGSIYIIDLLNYKVKKYSSTGAWMLTIGSTRGDSDLGGTDNQLYTPGYVGNFLSGSFSIIDYYGFGDLTMMKVKTYDNSGVYIGGFGKLYGDNNLSGQSAQMNNAFFQGIDSSGDIVVVDTGNNKIKKYSSTGSWLMTITGSVDYIDKSSSYHYQNTKSRDGTVYMLRDCRGKCIKIYSQTGQLLSQIGSYVSDGASMNNLSGTAAVFGGWSIGDIFAYSGGIYIKTSTQIKKYSLTGDWMMNIGSAQYSYTPEDNQLDGEDARFPSEYKMTADMYGNVYVFAVDQWNLGIAKIKKYSSTGAWLMEIGGPIGDNDLSGIDAQITPSYSARYIDVDTSGNIYVRADRLKKYSSTGAWLLTLGDGTTGGNNLSGRSAGLSYWDSGQFMVDNSGSIYVHNSYYFFRKYSSTGAFLYSVGSTGGGPGDNNLSYNSALLGYSRLGGIDAQNNLYVSDIDPGKIKVYSSTGLWLMTIGNSSYFGGNDLSGTSAFLTGPRLFSYYDDAYYNRPYNFADKDGNFYFLDGNDTYPPNNYYCPGDQMRKYSSTGAFLLRIGNVNSRGNSNNLSGPSANFQAWGCYSQGMVVDHSGSIWLGNGSYFMKKYSSTGAFIVTVGSEKTATPDQGDNNLSGSAARLRASPIGVAVDSTNAFYINDVSNKKIKKYSSTGAWLLTLGSGTLGDNKLSGADAQWYNTAFPPIVSYSGDIYARSHYQMYPQSYDVMKKYSSTGSWLLNIGSIDGNNNLSGTSAVFSTSQYGGGIKPDAFGNIWVNSTTSFYDPSTYNNVYLPRIKKYSATGSYLLTIGNGIEGDNQLDGENAELTNPNIANILDNGDIYIISWKSGDPYRIKKYSSTGVWLHDFVFDTSCMYNYPVVKDSGDVYGYDCTAGEFQKYHPDGSLDFSLPSSPNTRTTYFNNYYYLISNYNTIYKYDLAGNLIFTLGQGIDGDNDLSGTSALLSGIYYILIDSNDSIYHMNDTSFKKYDEQGNHIYTKPLPNGSYDMLMDARDNIYLYGDYSVDKYDEQGNHIVTLGQGIEGDNDLSGTSALFGVNYIDFDDDDNIFISSWFHYPAINIKKYSSTGSHIFTLGSSVSGDNDLSGTSALFSTNMDYYFDSYGNIIVVDINNNKIKLYSGFNGNWISTIGDGLGGNNEYSGTGASFIISSSIFSKSNNNIIIFDSVNNTIKKFIP